MDQQVITTIISTGGAVLTGMFGMWISANQIGKRLDDFGRRLDRLEDAFNTFKDVVNGKLAALDSDLGKLMDRRG